MDPYQTLGVSRHASAEEIHRAYRRLARRLHPDVGTDSAAEMARVNDAWRILGDRTRRAAYDAATAAADAGPAGADVRADAAGMRVQWRVRLLIVAAALLLILVVTAIVLVGFGRVGVSGSP